MLIKAPTSGEESGIGSGDLVGPAALVILVLILGATIYLWQAGYIRRVTAFFTILFLVAMIVVAGFWIYSSGA